MQKPQGYEQATTGVGNYTTLSTGGHVLEILRVTETKLKNYPVLEIVFDTHRADKQPAFYKEKYDGDVEQYGEHNTRYQGVHNLFLPTGDAEQDSYKWAVSRLKGFVTSVEESNPGFAYNWDEMTLRGKKVGGVFGEEEYQNRDGDIRTAIKLRYFCSSDSAPTQKPPKVKALKGSAPTAKKPSVTEQSIIDDLPFSL